MGRAGGASAIVYYGGSEGLGLWASLEFQDKTGPGVYYFSLRGTETDSLIFSDEQVDHRANAFSRPVRQTLGSGHRERLLSGDGSPELLGLLAGIRVYHFEDTSANSAIRRRGYAEDNRQLNDDGGNLAAFLFAIRQTQPAYYKRIIATIQQIAPFFEDFELEPMRVDSNSILLNWKDRDSTHLFGPHELSDGTLRTMALIALLAQPEVDLPPLIVIDEPEIGLHPYALEIVAALIKSASVHTTIVVATQSAGLVNQFAPEDIITVTRERAESKFVRQNSETLAAWLQDYSMGEIWERNLIGGTPSR